MKSATVCVCIRCHDSREERSPIWIGMCLEGMPDLSLKVTKKKPKGLKCEKAASCIVALVFSYLRKYYEILGLVEILELI